jgi:hypothetical protein
VEDSWRHSCRRGSLKSYAVLVGEVGCVHSKDAQRERRLDGDDWVFGVDDVAGPADELDERAAHCLVYGIGRAALRVAQDEVVATTHHGEGPETAIDVLDEEQ